ncbi:sialate O-acetylesterase [Flavobacterium sp. TMP13]|uniref:sialate O-acetylesterase n=1 Tax=Flavobacterium sp. TMP13 TaxID=3425950 RepID=UPI003D780F16
MKRLLLTIVILCFLTPKLSSAAIKLPNLVSDYMVLQRDVKIPIWGWADVGENVTVQFLGAKYETKTGKDGKWKLELKAVPAGGPFVMTLEGKNKITLNNILIGDVFLASGQSNMEFTNNSLENSTSEISKAHFPNIHYFKVPINVSNTAVEDVEGKWTAVSPESAGNFSAVAYFFAKDLYQKNKIPIGVIVSSWGGSSAEGWTDPESLQQFPEFKEAVADLKTGKDWHKSYIEYQNNIKAFKQSNRGVELGVNLNQYADESWSITDFPFELQKVGRGDKYGNSIWFRKKIELDSSFATEQISSLFLGKLNVDVKVYVNGTEITNRENSDEGTTFLIPKYVLKKGSNQIAIKFFQMWSGFIGMPGQVITLKNELGFKKEIVGDWKFNTTIEKETPAHISFNSVPSTIYSAMIAPLIPYPLKGIIWYQGESNADKPEQYRSLFPAMIKGWRSKWKSEIPFLFVQLANYMENQKQPADYQWAALREAQSLALQLPKTGMAVTIDIGDVHDIHPKNKKDVGQRLALAAQKVIYNDPKIIYSGPTFYKKHIENNQIKIEFKNIGSGLLVKDDKQEVKGFAIAGEDKVFYWAKGIQKGNTLLLYSESVKNPTEVRYNWANSPDGNIYNKEGLPAAPFRTDNYPLHFEKK